MTTKAQAQLLLITSAICLIVAPVIVIMSALEPSPSLIAMFLTLMGGLGLYSAMRANARFEKTEK